MSKDAVARGVAQILDFTDEHSKMERMIDFVHALSPTEKAIVFADKKSRVENICAELAVGGVQSQGIHVGQKPCDREEALDDWRAGRVKILVCTDVALKGIDIEDVTRIFNFDFPRTIEEYVRRLGLLGHAGKMGESVSMFTRSNSWAASDLILILKKGNQKVPDHLQKSSCSYKAWRQRQEMEKELSRPDAGMRGSRSGGGRWRESSEPQASGGDRWRESSEPQASGGDRWRESSEPQASGGDRWRESSEPQASGGDRWRESSEPQASGGDRWRESSEPQASGGDRWRESSEPQASGGDRWRESSEPQASGGDRWRESSEPQASGGDRWRESSEPQASGGDRGTGVGGGRGTRGRGRRRGMGCFDCGIGHSARDCPDQPGGLDGWASPCYVQPGYMSEDRPE